MNLHFEKSYDFFPETLQKSANLVDLLRFTMEKPREFSGSGGETLNMGAFSLSPFGHFWSTSDSETWKETSRTRLLIKTDQTAEFNDRMKYYDRKPF